MPETYLNHKRIGLLEQRTCSREEPPREEEEKWRRNIEVQGVKRERGDTNVGVTSSRPDSRAVDSEVFWRKLVVDMTRLFQ